MVAILKNVKINTLKQLKSQKNTILNLNNRIIVIEMIEMLLLN